MNCLVRNVRLQDIIFSKAGTIKLSFKAKRYFEQSWKSLNYFDNLFLQYFLLFYATLKNPPVLVTANRQILLFVESLLESAILSQFVVTFLLADMKAVVLTNLGIWQPPIL